MLQLWYSLLLQQVLWIPSYPGLSIKWVSAYLLAGISRATATVAEHETRVPYLGGPADLTAEKYVLIRKEGSVILVALPNADRIIYQITRRKRLNSE